jgi:hypothetical protein
VHKAMYSVQNRPREGELVVNGMKAACVNSVISGWKWTFWNRPVMLSIMIDNIVMHRVEVLFILGVRDTYE